MAELSPFDLSAVIHRAWLKITDSETAERLARKVEVPARLSLRSRYELIIDGIPGEFPREAFDLPFEMWRRQIDLFDQADLALKDNERELADRLFLALADTHRDGDYPMVLIDADIGLGDAARQADDVDAALERYAAALDRAEACRYRFAAARARLCLGYMQLRVGSADAACGEFEGVLATAIDKGWQLLSANALTGLGDAYQRNRRPLPAMHALLKALPIFESLGSATGLANAALQLGEVCRRESWTEEAIGWYRQAVSAAERAGSVIALSNALDGLAEIERAVGDLPASRRDHKRAFDAAGPGYPRGQGHALIGLAECAIESQNWPEAGEYYARAHEAYGRTDDYISIASALAGAARCAQRMGDDPRAIASRLEAVSMIETMRAAQQTHQYQGEYFQRFGGHHAAALRTAIELHDAPAFTAVFECVTGRRLAGLIAQAPAAETSEAELAEYLLDEADRRAGLAKGDPSGPDSFRHKITHLAELAQRYRKSEPETAAFDDVTARLYAPFAPQEAERTWKRTFVDAHVLLLVLLEDEGELAWLLRRRDGTTHMGSRLLGNDTRSLIGDLHFRGLPLDAVPADLEGLSPLFPQELLELLPEGEMLVLVPADLLWGLPWLALPIGDRFLGERHPVVFSPSLATLLHESDSPNFEAIGTVQHWISPRVHHQRIEGFQGKSALAVRPAVSAEDAKKALLEGQSDLFIAIAHGRPVRELVHYLEFDEDVAVEPVDMLSAKPPKALVLVSCWGAHVPEPQPGDPMTIATVALARGARMVVATSAELYDDAASSRLVNTLLARVTDMPPETALHQALVRWLSRSDFRSGRLSRWAPLRVLRTLAAVEESASDD